jgi:CheY-like chemotaxis protein
VSNCEQFHKIRNIDIEDNPGTTDHPMKPQSKTVLCIDDNQDLLECEKAFLESFGYNVLTAPSGRKGLELASLHSIDVVIVDYVMPEMNGRELAIEMRRLKPETSIIMLSGAVDVPERALRSADVFIPKALLVSHLLPAIIQSHTGKFDPCETNG